MDKVQIGVYLVKEPTEFTDRSYPTASWHQTILVQPGEYPVMAAVGKDGEVADTSIYVKLPGTITDAYFPSSFGGVIYGDGNRKESIGRDASHAMTPYAHALAARLAEPGDAPYKLGEGYSVVKIGFFSFLDADKEMSSYSIVRDGYTPRAGQWLIAS